MPPYENWNVIVNHLLNHEGMFRSFLRSGYDSMSNNILKNKYVNNCLVYTSDAADD